MQHGPWPMVGGVGGGGGKQQLQEGSREPEVLEGTGSHNA